MALYEDNILFDERAIERFWDKIDIPFPNNPEACWDWKAKKDKNGCGIFPMRCEQAEEPGGGTIWKSFRAPRLMWIIENDQPIPNNLHVIHSCDNETCCNPRHIRTGTPLDNAADRKLRGRWDTVPKGEKHVFAILTDAKVRKMCHLYFNKDWSPAALGRKFNVSRATVAYIVAGKSWKHITKTHIPKGFQHKYERCKNRNQKMYKSFKDGLSYKEISEKYDVAYRYVLEIIRKQRKVAGDPPTPLGFRSDKRKLKQ